MRSVRSQLELLHNTETPHAVRFDEGPPLQSRLAVLPSAFNPPTLAHMALLEAAARLHGVASTAALLTTRNVDKALSGAGFEDRVAMLLAAREQYAGLAVLATNQARIIDQEAALASVFPALQFDFVVGYDTLIRLFDERYYTDMRSELGPFFAKARVIALNRGDVDTRQVQDFVDREAGHFASSIVVAEIDAGPASLSSTLAREAFAQGVQSDIVPRAVAAYIAEHGLYR